MEGKTGTIARAFQLKAITLECWFCSRRTTIHVDRKRALHETVLWECFDCQQVDKEFTAWKSAVGRSRKHTS
ncbi:MAG TPA: hypothetical protein VN450_03595 [Candidatus Methylomirabilis sp.]|nr:hypothetical protein [Candidatus Methylomirabilis sp.]